MCEFHAKALEFISRLVMASPNGGAIVSQQNDVMVADLPIAIRLVTFFRNCGIFDDRDFATRSPPFLSDLESNISNSTVEFSEFFFCIG